MVDDAAVTEPDLLRLISGVLAERGPMAEEHLLAAIEETGTDLGEDPEEILAETLEDGHGPVGQLADDRWVWLPALLAGRVFTHRLAAVEVAHDLLLNTPDLEPLTELVESEDFQRLADGSPVVNVVPPFDAGLLAERGIPEDVVGDGHALLLPPGYLSGRGHAEGDLVGLGLEPDGLRLRPVPDHGPMREAVAGLCRAVDAVLAAEPDQPIEVETAVWTACADDPALFTVPLPPLSVALREGGLACDGGWVAAAGFDFRRWRTEIRRAAIARQHDLSEDEALAVQAIVTLYDQVADLLDAAAEVGADEGALAQLVGRRTAPADAVAGQEVRTAVKSVLPLLADPAVADAVLAETVGAGDEGAAALGLFAETLEPMAPRAARPALRWLLAKAHERLGDVARAETEYQAAESLDPDFRPVLLDLARYASDRGDSARGLALLRRAGAGPEHPLTELLHRFAAAPPSTLGRNDPCWCGSGRKYKKCHLNREQLPLEERAAWLYQKAGMYLHEGGWIHAMVDAATARSAFDDRPDALLHALDDPLVADAVLFEVGAFADFIATRGTLLPDDERLLAEQWQLVERSVHEITEVRRGKGLAVRDVRTGDTHQVRERTASRQLESGQLICARVVPAGDTMQIFGGIEPVGLNERDELIKLLDGEPDAIDLIKFLTRRFAPPAIQNTEGEPLVLCEATLRTDDPARLAAELERNYQRDESAQPPLWIEEVITGGMPRVRATLTLAGNELTVQANSEARFDRVLAAVRDLDPTLGMVKQSRTPARDAREVAALAASQPAEDHPVLDANDPEIAAALEAFVRDYERTWLDESIPALAGQTPRQAAADPTHREDLIRLLDTFPNDLDNLGLMSPDRLRTALGLGS